jgi:HD-like signal output (HDOD) protein
MTQFDASRLGDARARLNALVAEIGELRPLGATARQILHITSQDRFSAYELAGVIASDQALTSKMLRLANSAYYGFARRITTMRDAVVLLGFREVRSATLASCVIEAVPASRHIDYDRFWHYSATVGMLAEVLARAERRATDEAFTAGIVHNIGRLALDQHRPAQFGEALAVAERDGISLYEAEIRVVGFTDAELGGALARFWDFPAELAEAVEQHDAPPDALPARSLAGLVSRARRFAHAHGVADGVEGPAPSAGPADEWSIPPLATSLETAGGFEGLLVRANAFVEHAIDR